MKMFHNKCGSHIKLSNDKTTATRTASEFSFGLVFSSEPLNDDELFEIRIDKKIYSWIGSLVVGVTTCDPDDVGVPPNWSDFKPETWLLTGNTLVKDGRTLLEFYPLNLDLITEGERVGILRTSQGELEFFVNGVSFGVAATNVPQGVFALIDVYGKVAQVSVVPPGSVLEMDRSTEVEVEESICLPVEQVVCQPPPERMRFYHRTGTLVKLSSNGRSAERLRPMDEFNNAVLMTHRPLLPDALFEIRIDRLVDKWSGSIEVGVTCHDPAYLEFPATMTNMRSGTVMMSGCGILTNGKGTKRQYGQYNLDQLRVGDRIGMMRKSNGDLHYYINGMDQGVAANNVPEVVWSVVDLYGMTVKVTIVDRDEREEQNLITRRNAALKDNMIVCESGEEEMEDRLSFHPNCGSHAAVVNNGLTAHRPNAMDDFNNAVVLSNRPLKINEVFEVRLDKMVSKWAGSIEIGVTTHGPTELEYPSTMTNVRSGTWIMTGAGVMHNGQSVIDEYGTNLDRLGAGDRVGVVIRDGGSLHFLVNGVDQGEAGVDLPPDLFAVVDLYGQASQASIVAQCPSCVPTPTQSHPPNPPDIHFHSVHGRNARVSNNGRTASRPRAMAEFNDAIVITNRPLAPGEMFSVIVERIVDRWSGSIEAGVTAIHPNDLELPGTMTDLDHDTWMLSGFAVMKDGVTLRHGYPLDLDKVSQGSVIGLKRHDDATLHYYLDGVDMGEACTDIPPLVYPCIDLYGQCAQVSIVSSSEGVGSPSVDEVCSPQISLAQGPMAPIASQSETTVTVSVPPSNREQFMHKLVSWKGTVKCKMDQLESRGCMGGIAWSSNPIHPGELFEVVLMEPRWSHHAGSLSIGVTSMVHMADSLPLSLASITQTTYYVQGCDVYKTGGQLVKTGLCGSLNWLRPGNKVGLKRCHDSTVRLYINSIDQGVIAHNLPKKMYAVVHVYGSTSGVRVVSQEWMGEAPLASLDAESPSDKQVEAQGCNEKGLEDMEKSIDDGDLPSEIHDQPQDEEEVIDATPETCSSPVFHECHGRNVQLSANRLAAKRVSSYNQGLVVSTMPLNKQQPMFQVRIDSLNPSWTSSLSIGVTSQCCVTSSLPVTALGLKRDTWIIAGDALYHNGHLVKRVGADLDSLTVGSTAGLSLDSDYNLRLVINSVEVSSPVITLPQGKTYLPVVDLYGMCDQVSVVGWARPQDLTWGRRMASSWGDSTTSGARSKSDKMNENIQCSLSSQAQRWGSVGELNWKCPAALSSKVKCESLSQASRLNQWLLTPKVYLSGESECLCVKCSDKSDCNGWTRHCLNSWHAVASSSWHSAYSTPVPLGRLRTILDRSHLLTPSEMNVSHGFCRNSDSKDDSCSSNQLVLTPSLEYAVTKYPITHFWNDGGKDFGVTAVFEVAVRPGSYKVSPARHGVESLEWVTKERNSTVLTALLFRISPSTVK